MFRLAATFFGVLLGACATADEWRFDSAGDVVAISDVHGDYAAMVSTLQRAGVLDEASQWSAGNTQLVITGDLLDRGPDSRAVMDLVRTLESSAPEQGGAVHLLLGNHEVMNLVGDLRYVADEEYAAFAAEEDPEERERWFQRHLAQLGLMANEDEARQAWNMRRPPGFFAHRRAFRGDGDYGRWLLQKPLLIVINGTAFVHGGLSPRIAELGLEGVNGRMKDALTEYVQALDVLTDAGLLAPSTNFYRHAEVLASANADDPAVAAAIATVAQGNDAEVHAPDSPLWYRGNIGCSAPIESDRLDAVLAAIDAQRVVIGHTPTRGRQVLTRLGGRVVEIDTGMLNAYYGGMGSALLLRGDELKVVGETAAAPGDALPHPRRVGMRAPGVSAADLEEVLARGALGRREQVALGELVSVEYQGVAVKALFLPSPRRKGFVPELAAYRLDRLLELGMVPVTVAREVGGTQGVLQFLPEQRADEVARSASSLGGSAWCPLRDQWQAMYVFDALIHNPGRAQQHMLYSPDNWQLLLIGHGESFGTARDRPAYLKQVPLRLNAYWQERLAALTDDDIASIFAESLDRRRQRALGQRRDRLLQSAAEQARN